MTTAADLAARARAVLPGGVNSPVRAFAGVGGDPVFAREAHGAYLTDLEGNRLIDYVLSWGAVLLGHDHPDVRESVQAAVARGTSYGMTSEPEVELAEAIVDMVPSVEMVRLVNSGTEATMSALRLARAVTGRKLVVKMEGGYHGHGESFLVSAGSGVATLGLPNSPGVPEEIARLTVTVPFNDYDAMDQCFERHGANIAAVIVEPFMGNAGFIPPIHDYLARLRQLTADAGALLVYDEVMTGFRVRNGGAQELVGVYPDLTTFGKVIGGGFPVGAYGGSREFMEYVAPAGSVYQAGTLSGNPVAMTAGAAVLRYARDCNLPTVLDSRSKRLAEELTAVANAAGVPFTADSAGGMWGFFFHPGPVRNFEDATQSDTGLFARFHRAARKQGVLLAPSPYEAAFVSAAHTDDIIDQTVAKLGNALDVAISG